MEKGRSVRYGFRVGLGVATQAPHRPYEHYSRIRFLGATAYRQIVETLVDGTRELHELCEMAGIEGGGTISRYLDDLAMSGFVARDVSYAPNLLTARPQMDYSG